MGGHSGSKRRIAEAAALLAGAIFVVDADTVDMDGRRYRLAGFDAPEIGFARCGSERELGIRAAARVIDLIRYAKQADLVSLGKQAGWGRTLGRLTIDGKDLRDFAIEEGWGVPYDVKAGRKSWC